MTDTLTAERLEELERLAREATPGPWWNGVEDYGELAEHHGAETVFCMHSLRHERVLLTFNYHFPHAADSAFVCAARPATVLALLAERAALIARIRELEIRQ